MTYDEFIKLSEIQKKNYERLIYSLAVSHAKDLDIDIKTQDEYSKLSEPQKNFAKKIYEEHKDFETQVKKEKRIPEKKIIEDTAEVIKEENKNLINGSKFAKWVSVGDGRVCEKCKKYENKIICISGSSYGYPTLKDVIKSGALHSGCRCALLDVDIKEIELKSPNPRASQKVKKKNPEAYNYEPKIVKVFSGYFHLG